MYNSLVKNFRLEYKLFSNLCKSGYSVVSSEPAFENPDKDENPETKISLKQRFVYPEFLPDPNLNWRNSIREKLERMDMIKRRLQIEIPEFYVGSIISVTSANPHASSKTNTFLGICIQRRYCGLRAEFTVRNVIDNLGTEICYKLYDPKIIKINVIRLEKRLDDELLYLRDALPEFSTFPLDMEPEVLPEGSEVPINTTKVLMKPRPWCGRWERKNFKGVDTEQLMSLISEKMKFQIPKHQTPWEKYDLMKIYRNTIPEEDQKEIFAELQSELHQQEISRQRLKRKRAFVKPKKSA